MHRWLLVGMIAMLFGCARSTPQSAIGSSDRPGLRILALGDSYTIGQGVAPDDNWPSQLAAALRNDSWEVGELTIVARTGWTTADLSDAMNHADLHGTYDLVTLLVGVNNQYQGLSVEEYGQQFSDLLQRAVRLTGQRAGRVIVVSIPDWGVTPFAHETNADSAAVAAAIDKFNSVNKVMTEQAAAVYVNITPITRQMSDAVVDDGLHPDPEQYSKWVQTILPIAEKALRR
jgi:lysophospholipase L1-like esterase